MSPLLANLLDSFRAALGPPLKALHEPLDRWLISLPLDAARACLMALFGIVAVWVFSLKREYIFRGAPDQRGWRDLRIWGIVLLLPYATIYWFLGH